METKTQWGVRKSKVRVLLVDDHPILRKGLAQLINQDPRLAVCGEAEDAPQAIKAIETLLPDLVIMDISLKLGNGIELLKTVKPHFPDLPVLVLSMHDEALYAERLLRAGAMGYIMKDDPAEQVLLAIWQVLAFLAESWPQPPITRNQIELMSIDNIASPACPGFGTLGIEPAGIEAVLATKRKKYESDRK